MNFELTLEEANIVLGGLSKLPYEHSAGLIQKMQQQAQPQLPTNESADEPTAE